jgi:hypothetical protein
MVGQVQRLNADNVRVRVAQARAVKERGETPKRVTHELSGLPPKTAVKAAVNAAAKSGARAPARQGKAALTSPPSPSPPALPLDAAEADLCERLQGLLSKAPRRCGEEAPSAQITFSDRIATAAEVVPEPAELPPLTELPALDPETTAPAVRSIKWVQRSRRERLKSALGYSVAWIVTLGVIAMTVVGVTVLTLGMDTSVKLAAKAGKQGAEAASTAVVTLKRIAGQ